MSNRAFDISRRPHHPYQRHAALHAEPFEHVQQILGREIAGRTWRVRTATKPTGGTVERRDAMLQRREHVGQRGAARIVKVQRNLVDWNTGQQLIEQIKQVE